MKNLNNDNNCIYGCKGCNYRNCSWWKLYNSIIKRTVIENKAQNIFSDLELECDATESDIY